MNFHRSIFYFLFLFAVQTAYAQGGATVKATVDKNRILIGEPLQLVIEVNLSPGSVISFINIDTIDHFELLDKPVIDTINANGGTTIKGIYKFTSFDSGHWVIPSFVLFPKIKTDTIPVDVVFSDFDPNQDYHDIKDIIEVAPEKKKQWWWLIAGGALLLAAVAVYLLRKKKPVARPAPEIMIDPYEEAMKELEQLQRDKPEAKKYHSKLTDIFRLYIFRKKGILSLQKTTADLVLQLRDLNLNKEQFDKLSQALRLSDFVKFAKYVPTSDDDRNCFEEIKNSIITIEKTEAKSSV
jgi:LPXTG-motif cell wall-anchored protein